MRMAAGFGLVWLIIDDLRLHLDGLSLLLQAQMLGAHACVEVAQLPAASVTCSKPRCPCCQAVPRWN